MDEFFWSLKLICQTFRRENMNHNRIVWTTALKNCSNTYIEHGPGIYWCFRWNSVALYIPTCQREAFLTSFEKNLFEWITGLFLGIYETSV